MSRAARLGPVQAQPRRTVIPSARPGQMHIVTVSRAGSEDIAPRLDPEDRATSGSAAGRVTTADS